MSNSITGEETFTFKNSVSSLDDDLEKKEFVKTIFQVCFGLNLLGDACLELDLEILPPLSPESVESTVVKTMTCLVIITVQRIRRH